MQNEDEIVQYTLLSIPNDTKMLRRRDGEQRFLERAKFNLQKCYLTSRLMYFMLDHTYAIAMKSCCTFARMKEHPAIEFRNLLFQILNQVLNPKPDI